MQAPETIVVNCPHCGQRIRFPKNARGTSTCGKCKRDFYYEPSESPIRWGPKSFDRARGTEHFLLVGASGSGKTTLVKAMMRSIMDSEHIFTGLVYDPKQELLPSLFSFRGDTKAQVRDGTSSVRVLNPFDERCCSWELYKDIDGPVSAREFATILVPDGESSSGGEQFFTNAVRDILTGVMLLFINCASEGCKWTLRDLLLGVLYQPYLNVLLEQTTTRQGTPFPLMYRLKSTYFSKGVDPRTLGNIIATMSAKLSVYEPVAAAWHRAQLRGPNFSFSLKDWATGKYSDILVLGNDEAGRSSIDPINRAIFQRATELVLARAETTSDQKNSGEQQTWFFLDEVREAGKLGSLGSLLTKGRSKGACVVLAFQDIEGMRDAYGEEVANELCGQCNNSIILRLNSPATAEWASEHFGTRVDLSQGGAVQGSGLSQSTSFQEQERPYYYTSDFLYLPTASYRAGISGYSRNPEVNPDAESARWHLDANELSGMLGQEPKGDGGLPTGQIGAFSPFATAIPTQPQNLYMQPWSQSDWDRLGLKWRFDRIATSQEEAEALNLPPRLKPVDVMRNRGKDKK